MKRKGERWTKKLISFNSEKNVKENRDHKYLGWSAKEEFLWQMY